MPLTTAARTLPLALAVVIASCAPAPHATNTTATTPDEPQAPASPLPSLAQQLHAAHPLAVSIDIPTHADIRPRLNSMRLTPRPQGHRGTCSIFTTCSSIEFAYAELTGERVRLSPEYLNWAAGKAAGGPSDGNFFHNALAGFEKYGVCDERSMPYLKTFDAAGAPTVNAAEQAKKLRDSTRDQLIIHWIVPWQAGKTGVNEEQFDQIRRVLAKGYPVAAGSGHSRLLVGYTDDPSVAGGGEFLTEDSALNRFDKVTYEFVRKQVNDVFWIEAAGTNRESPRTLSSSAPDDK